MKEKAEALYARFRGRIPTPAVLVLVVGCLLLLIPTGGAVKETQTPQRTAEETFDLRQFEMRLEDAISRIEGAGESRVVLTTAGGSRRVLAKDREQDVSGGSERAVVIGRSGEEQVVELQRVAPEFRGALVVCPGAGDAAVRLEVTKAVSVLTGLGADRICVSIGQ